MRLLKNKTFILFLFLGRLVAQELWNDSGEIFTDQKFKAVGSIVYIQFEKQIYTSFRSRYQKLKVNNDNLLRDLPEVLDFLPKINSDTSKQSKSDTAYSIDQQLTGIIAATIVKIDYKTKTYIIKANQSWDVNGKIISISITGKINQRDLTSDGKVDSQKIANTQINFLGHTFNKGNQIKEEDFNSLTFPSSEENNIDINKEKKNQLYLSILNLILNELL